MTNRNRPLPLLLLACLTTTTLLTACTQSPKAGRPNTTPPESTSPSATSSTPSSTATPTTPSDPPQRPAAASGLTLAAAEAFYRYYVDLKNYAAATGDTAALLSASEAGCEGCKEYAAYVAKVNAANGGLAGDYQERVREVSELVRGGNGRLGGSAVITVGNYTTKNAPSATPIISKAAEFTDQIALSPSGQNWVMYETQFEER